MTNDLKYSLAELADADAPPSVIDIDKARHDGRRRAVVGRVAPIGTGVAVVAACGIAVSGMVSGSSPTRSTAGGSNATTQTHAPAKATEFTGTDPLSAHAAFGKLPDGWVQGTIDDGPDYGNSNHIYRLADGPLGTSASMQVSDKQLSAESFGPGGTTEPATVPGSPKAEYITVPGRPGLKLAEADGLQWQTAGGEWVALFVNGIGTKAASRTMLDSLAAGVTVGDTEVPLPLHIDGLPKDLPVYSEELNVPGLTPGANKYFSVDLVFGSIDKPVMVDAAPLGTMTPPKTTPPSGAPTLPEPTVKIDRACKDDNGLTVCVTTQAGNLDSVGGAKGLLDHITSLGTDRANWTTHVIG